MKTRTSFTVLIPPERGGVPVQDILREHGFSRRLLIGLKKIPDSVRLDGEPVYLVVRARAGQTLHVELPNLSPAENIVPSNLPLDIVYEDEDLFVLNKPAGMPVHPSQGHYSDTLCNALAFYLEQQGDRFSAHAVGRLDRDTSGLVLFARHELSSCILSAAMRGRRIHREYRAVCTGILPAEGTIDAPIARAHGSTMERIVSEDGDPAVTHFRRLDCANGYSLAAVRLETGRTHQIRVHMKHIGHPLPGDFLYNPDYFVIGRQALHSWQLSFPHPITGAPLTFTAPIPEDLRAILRKQA